MPSTCAPSLLLCCHLVSKLCRNGVTLAPARGACETKLKHRRPVLFDDPACLARQLGHALAEGPLSGLLGDAVNLEEDEIRPYRCHPILDISFACAHSTLRNALGDGLMREDADPDLASAGHDTDDRATHRLDLMARNPRLLQDLESVLPKVGLVPPLGVAPELPLAAVVVGLQGGLVRLSPLHVLRHEEMHANLATCRIASAAGYR
mmetsp:Transcript_113183/g.231671  ORF Transcript_113183/g.231671 Transcript_113183/m.231671 type:complete len:207 (-) Transcript_113183:422-1042(-)